MAGDCEGSNETSGGVHGLAENSGRWRVIVKVVMILPVELMDWLRIVAGGG